MPMLLKAQNANAKSSSLRRAPSLEENLENSNYSPPIRSPRSPKFTTTPTPPPPPPIIISCTSPGEEEEAPPTVSSSSSLPTNYFETFKESSKKDEDEKSMNNYVVVDASALALGELGGVSVKDMEAGGVVAPQKLVRLNASRAAKLAKILSVVEEGNVGDSPTMERKYEIVTNQV
jgi:hypothetical protein